MIKLNTERLIIRDHKEDDLESHHKLMSNDKVMRFIQDIQTHSFEESTQNLAYCIEESIKGDRQCYFFAIVEKSTSDHVGSIGFTILDFDEQRKKAELGYFIHEKYWGIGYTSEAVKAVIQYAFDTLDLHKLVTGCNAENLNSEKIMLKHGFQKEAHLRQHVFHEGLWKDRVEYGMLKKDWMNHAR